MRGRACAGTRAAEDSLCSLPRVPLPPVPAVDPARPSLRPSPARLSFLPFVWLNINAQRMGKKIKKSPADRPVSV